MALAKFSPWDFVGIGLGLASSAALWWLLTFGDPDAFEHSHALWVAFGPLAVVIVQVASVLLVSPPSRVVRISAPLAVIANVEDICSLLFYPRSSTAGLGLLIAPAIGVTAFLMISPVVWALDWLYRAGVEPSKHARPKNGA